MFNMMFHLLLSIYPADIKENSITNTCDFKILRFQKKDIMCIDYGLNKKYCNHYSLPYEFHIYNEIGINNKENIIIKPHALYEEYSNYKTKIATFYYTFTCSHLDNEPKLLLNIVPEFNYDKSLTIQFYELISTLFTIFTLLFIIVLICPCLANANLRNSSFGFSSGYILGNYNNPIIYCE
tara:strand:+ start:67 stop:609 length:543 start_codon:yes stop_codon:yes gene_type:complete